MVAMALVVLMLSPLAGSLSAPTNHFLDSDNLQFIEEGQTIEIPHQAEIWWDEDIEWWDVTTLDMDRNGIHDSLQNAIGQVNVGVSYDHEVTEEDREILKSLGFVINVELPVVNALLLGDIDSSQIWQLSEIDGVVMVERYGSLVFYGDVQTPTVKARNSTEYPEIGRASCRERV